MAPLVSNDLNSPVCLLWAHQLRREHTTIVAQLEELKSIHPSASELKKLVTRTEKAEAATNKFRKDLTDLKTAYQKNVKVVAGLEKEFRAHEKACAVGVSAREKNEESSRQEIEGLRDVLTRQGAELAGTADQLSNVRDRAEEENAAMRQKLVQREDEVVELRQLIQMLQRRIEGVVTVVKDSVEGFNTTEAPAARQDDVSEVGSFDLDANVQTVTAAPSGPVLGPSLAMIKEPTVPRHSQRLRDQQLHLLGESFQMLPEPSSPSCPQQFRSKEAADKPASKTVVNLAQGKSNLTAYIQIADSQHHETPLGREEQFVDAFIRGLRDKRDKIKCEKKLRGARKTWGNLKDCFPVASQHSQNKVDMKRHAEQKDVQEEKQMESTKRPRIIPVSPPRERTEIEGIGKEEGKNPRPTLPRKGRTNQTKQTNRGAERNGRPPEPKEVKKTSPVEQDKREAQKAVKWRAFKSQEKGEAGGVAKARTLVGQNEQQAGRARLPMTPPGGLKKRILDEQANEEAGGRGEVKPPAPKKRRIKKTKERRQKRPPSIPILPSSDDEFSRGGRK